jgi:hypothetical protein
LENHRKWTAEEVELLFEMLDKGYGYNNIAATMNRSELGVRGKLERMNYQRETAV